MSDNAALQALIAQHIRGALVTLKRDGRPQLSNVAYRYDPEAARFDISTENSRAKAHNVRRDPRVSFYVTTSDLGAYVVADCTASLSAVAQDPNDPIVDELVEHYRTIRGDHSNWPEFRAAMAAEGRVLIRLHVERIYGYAGNSS